MMRSLRQPVCQLSKREKWRIMLEGMMILVFFAYFFYRSPLAIPFLLPVYFLYSKIRIRETDQKKRRELAYQFKDAVLTVSTNLKAGYSVENSFREAYGDMQNLYGKESGICQELHRIVTGLLSNITLEQLLSEFAKRSRVEDVKEFADVFAAAKRSGGNMVEIMERSAAMVSEKLEVEKEIDLLISARRMEQKIMNLVPFGIIFYISITSRGFFDPLYYNTAGIIVMTVCLLTYLGAILLSGRMVDIRI